MWIPQAVVSWLDVSLDTVRRLREENAALRAEADSLSGEVRNLKITGDWLRMKVNDLEALNKGLLEKAYDIRLPVPQIVKAVDTSKLNPYKLPQALFEHIEDEAASHNEIV